MRFLLSAPAVVAVALTTRLLVLVAFWPTWIWQSGQVHDDWDKLAINWVESGTFGFVPGEPSTLRGPVFPLLEALLYLLFGADYAGWSIALLLFDTGTALLIVLLGRRLWGPTAAVLAGLFYALYLPLIYYTANIEQFTVVLPFVFLWLYLVTAWDQHGPAAWRSIALGGVSGILVLSKPVYLPVVIAAAAGLLYLADTQLRRATLRHVAIMLVATALLVAPWTHRNYVVSEGRFIPVQSFFWEAIWQKFVLLELDEREGLQRPNGRTHEYLLDRQRDLLQGPAAETVPRLTGPRRELHEEETFKGEVLAWIEADPTAYLANVWSNAWYFWIGAENLQKTLLMASMQLPLLGAALIGLGLAIRYGRVRSIRFGLALIAILWSEHALIFGWGRYSLDLAPALTLVFGTGVAAWLSQRGRASARQRPFVGLPMSTKRRTGPA